MEALADVLRVAFLPAFDDVPVARPLDQRLEEAAYYVLRQGYRHVAEESRKGEAERAEKRLALALRSAMTDGLPSGRSRFVASESEWRQVAAAAFVALEPVRAAERQEAARAALRMAAQDARNLTEPSPDISRDERDAWARWLDLRGDGVTSDAP